MALKDPQHTELQKSIREVRESAKQLMNYNSGNPEIDKIAEIMGRSLNKLVSMSAIHYGELQVIGDTIYDV